MKFDMKQEVPLHVLALRNTIIRAKLDPKSCDFHGAIAWAQSSRINALEVQAEWFALAGIPLDEDVYLAARERAERVDAATTNTINRQ